MRWNYILGSFGLLIVASYLDNIRGPLIPVLRRELALSYGVTSWFLVAGNFASVGAVFLMLPLTRRFSEKSLSLGAAGIGILAAMIALITQSLAWVLVLAVLLGAAISSSGAICNLLLFRGTRLQYRSRLMCGLHMMYGFGSLFAPTIAGIFFAQGFPWPWVIVVGGAAFAALALFFLTAFPGEEAETAILPSPLRMEWGKWLTIITFCLYVAAEVLTSMWMVTYLIEHERMPVEIATRYLSGFFLMIAATRFFCFLSLGERAERWALWGSPLLAIAMLSAGYGGWLWGFPLAGILGPFFPLFLARVTRDYPEDGPKLTLVMLTAVQLMQALCHLSIGRLVDSVGIRIAYGMPWFLLVLVLATQPFHARLEKARPAV